MCGSHGGTCRLAERAQLFGAAVPALLTRHYGFTTAHLAAIDEDASADLAGVAAVLEQALGIRGASWQQRQTAQEVCRLVCLRSARLCAAAIAGVLKRSGHPCGGGGAGDGPSSTGGSSSQRVVVAVDGSVFSKYRQYRCAA
jgi:hexokinase